MSGKKGSGMRDGGSGSDPAPPAHAPAAGCSNQRDFFAFISHRERNRRLLLCFLELCFFRWERCNRSAVPCAFDLLLSS